MFEINSMTKEEFKSSLIELLKLALPFIRPSIAKVIIWPSMAAGISFLNPPFWIDLLNSLLIYTNLLPGYQIPEYETNYPWACGLIGLAFVVYCIDTYFQTQRAKYSVEGISSRIENVPEKTAKLVAQEFEKRNAYGASPIVDESINKAIYEIHTLRTFDSFPTIEKSIDLAKSILEGEMSFGSAAVKAKALALIARYLSNGPELIKAKEYLEVSKRLAKTHEASLAEIFIDVAQSRAINVASKLLVSPDPVNYSAYLMIKAILEGHQAAVDWYINSGLNFGDLDSDGQCSLIRALLNIRNWSKALEIVELIREPELIKSPVLAHLSALTYLANSVKAEELRSSIITYLPFAADKFPLADDQHSLAMRKQAIRMLNQCEKLSAELNVPIEVSFAQTYSLWLKLRDKDTAEMASQTLTAIIENYDLKSLDFLPLAYAFKVKIDFEAIEKLLDRQTALHGTNDPQLGVARFVLAHTKKTAAAILQYINTHRKQLESANKEWINYLEVEILAKTGLIDDAEALLKSFDLAHYDLTQIKTLEAIIAAERGQDPVAIAISQYNESKKIADLAQLVYELKDSNLHEKCYEYAIILFENTGQVGDALTVCNALSSSNKFPELHQFLLDNMDLVERDNQLKFHWTWAQFRKGNLNQVKILLEELRPSLGNLKVFQDLEINVDIFSGNWEALSIIIESKWQNSEELSAQELIQVANLAKAISPNRARQLVEFATKKFPEDPNVLAASYFTASAMGWENKQEVSGWLNKAMQLSGEDGPLQSASYEEMMKRIAASRDRNEHIYKNYIDGTSPISTIAPLLNKTLSDFYLVQPLKNRKNTDIRRKSIVSPFPNFIKNRLITERKIVLDASSVLTMSLLGILRLLYSCFDKIVIPHSFMLKLFEETQKVSYHQPSQVAQARQIESLVSNGKIHIFKPKRICNPKLALDVGDELADFINESLSNSSTEIKTLVVCPYPVFKIGVSFKEDEIDLSEHQHCLISASQLIKKLELDGQVTQADCDQAIMHLKTQEQVWPVDINVPKNSNLLVDAVSIIHLFTSGMLENVADAGYKVFIHHEQNEVFKTLINNEEISKEVEVKLEEIRQLLIEGINTGKVELAEMPTNDFNLSEYQRKITQSASELIEAFKNSEAAIVDDRFINQNEFIKLNDRDLPIYSTLDFLETIQSENLITMKQKYDFRATLRETGFAFLPLQLEELQFHLDQSNVAEGNLVPTRQLNLIKDNLLLLKISGVVKLPKDGIWLIDSIKKVCSALISQWAGELPEETSIAKSNWLYELLDMREWAQSHSERIEGGIATSSEALKVYSLIISTGNLPNDKQSSFKKWLENYILNPLKTSDPYSYNLLLQSAKDEGVRLYQGSDLNE